MDTDENTDHESDYDDQRSSSSGGRQGSNDKTMVSPAKSPGVLPQKRKRSQSWTPVKRVASDTKANSVPRRSTSDTSKFWSSIDDFEMEIEDSSSATPVACFGDVSATSTPSGMPDDSRLATLQRQRSEDVIRTRCPDLALEYDLYLSGTCTLLPSVIWAP